MKTLQHLILWFTLATLGASTAQAAANDIQVSQRNPQNTAWVDRIFAPASGTSFTTASGFLQAIGGASSSNQTFTNVTLNGTLNGTPTGGTLNLSSVNVVLPPGDTQGYNANDYGILPDNTDSSPELSALLLIVHNAGGGTIYFPPSTLGNAYLFNTSITFPNNGESIPTQAPIRLKGGGSSPSSAEINGSDRQFGGTTFDVRVTSGVAFLDTRGKGLLEIDRINFTNGGNSSVTTPFIHTTNTILRVHDCLFLGSASVDKQTCNQDAIILGGTTTSLNGSATAGFQGYGTVIERNQFQKIRRGVYLRVYANAVMIQNNNWWRGCGAPSNDYGAIDFNGETSPGAGPHIAGASVVGNLIEVEGYSVGIRLQSTRFCTFVANNFYDPHPNTEYYMYFGANAYQNLIYEGLTVVDGGLPTGGAYYDGSGNNTYIADTGVKSRTLTSVNGVSYGLLYARPTDGLIQQRSGFTIDEGANSLLAPNFTASGNVTAGAGFFDRPTGGSFVQVKDNGAAIGLLGTGAAIGGGLNPTDVGLLSYSGTVKVYSNGQLAATYNGNSTALNGELSTVSNAVIGADLTASGTVTARLGVLNRASGGTYLQLKDNGTNVGLLGTGTAIGGGLTSADLGLLSYSGTVKVYSNGSLAATYNGSATSLNGDLSTVGVANIGSTLSVTGQSTFSNGSSSAPSFRFAGANSGLFRTGNSIGIVNNGIQSGRIDGITGSGGLYLEASGTNQGVQIMTNGTGGITLGGASTDTTVGRALILGSPLATNYGGTGQTTYTNGQLLIGNTTGNTLTKATLTAGSGIVITNGTGSITISTTGVLPTTETTGTTQALAVNSRYILNNASLVTATLPTTAAVGDKIEIIGKGAGLWRVAQNASQIIHGATNTTTGTGGYIQAQTRYDCVILICTVANLEFTIQSQSGTLTTN